MFQKIQYQLLLTYLTVLTSILVTFAIAVRVVFARTLTDEYKQKLTELARSGSSDMYFVGGQLEVHGDFSSEELDSRYQALEWFDLQGNLVSKKGRYVVNLPFSTQKIRQIETDERRFQGFILPVMNPAGLEQKIGYVRASQSPADLDRTLNKLDWGLGGSVTVALVFSSIGGIILTRQAMQPVEQSFQRLKQFTADASHELRGPLMAIKSNVAVALKYPEGMRDSDAEKFKAINSAVSQMTQLTEDLLFLARNDQAPSQAHDPVDLGKILENLVRLYAPQAQEKGIHLEAHLSENLYLLGEPDRLSRLFSNLIENALRYTPEGGIVQIQARKNAYYLQVQVRDTGVGIAPEHLKHIFDRFSRVDRPRSYHNGGFGLGLAIARAIAQNHGGIITVTSTVGVGSCFTVRLRACGRS